MTLLQEHTYSGVYATYHFRRMTSSIHKPVWQITITPIDLSKFAVQYRVSCRREEDLDAFAERWEERMDRRNSLL